MERDERPSSMMPAVYLGFVVLNLKHRVTFVPRKSPMVTLHPKKKFVMGKFFFLKLNLFLILVS